MAVTRNPRAIGFFIGVAAFVASLLLPPPPGMPPEALRVAGIATLMAAWWIAEIVPVPVTAMLPLVLFPLFAVAPLRDTAAPYADPIVFLFLGGFILGAATQRWSLHARIGLRIIAAVGTSPHRLSAGLILASAFLSMWVSNTATAIMMLPIATAVTVLYGRQVSIGDQRSGENLGIVLHLSVAYGASIGGLATLIGTPPNALLAGHMAREYGIQIGFAQWMMLGVPVSAAMLAAAWFVLNRLHPVSPANDEHLGDAVAGELRKLGRITPAEIRVIGVLALAALGWIFRPLLSPIVPGLHDSIVAVAAGVALFLLPSGMPEGGRLMVWKDTKDIPWGVLLLFGGGLSLAAAIDSSGLAAWLASSMSALVSWPVIVIVAAATLGMIFLTELTSNTASAATFLPFGAAVAVGLGIDPLALTVPMALAASCAFMLPVATPPNAIVYASGRITIAQMAYAGLWLNVIGAVLIVLLSYPASRIVFGN
ncbi:MAG: SLC13 family permease [Pseudolabrys sp.]|nr:SLC13 family permease [Pseudolabrys sp.]